ncbi:MAG: D-alanyl-D-alanine carboxypeptidase [Betaproteobacteria bacterium]|nr:D-alanyl-D-alanine carboxypeptidase [Betaproteobacteria bacterium]
MLASEQGERRFEPASLTKLMTAYLVFQALERGDIERSRIVTASKAALLAPGARMYLDERHPATIDQLLRGLIVQSGNDAAVALAETVAGSESRFVERMNAQAQRLGLTNTRFANASGKPEAQHYSTSHDMARLAAALIRDFPKDYRLLGRDPSVDGLKTGQTPAAGYCLVSSAKRGERRIIAVVMGAANDAARAAQSQRLLNLGFTRWDAMRVGGSSAELARVRVWKGESRDVALGLAGETLLAVPHQRRGRIQPRIEVRKLVEAPVTAGQPLGRLTLVADGETLAEYPLVAREPVELGGFFRRLVDTALLWLE